MVVKIDVIIVNKADLFVRIFKIIGLLFIVICQLVLISCNDRNPDLVIIDPEFENNVENPDSIPIRLFGNQLYIGGLGSEHGQTFRFFESPDEDSYYEIYSKIEANKPFYFYTEDENRKTLFCLDADTNIVWIEGDISVKTKIPISGIYRIRLNFNTMQHSLQMVEKVVLRSGDIETNDIEFLYDKHGCWKIDNYNICISLSDTKPEIEDCYMIVFTIDGQEEFWGKVTDYTERPNLAMTDYRNLLPLNNNQWTAAFRFPNEFVNLDSPTSWWTRIVLYMNTEKGNYTHDFLDFYAEVQENKWSWHMAADSCTFILVDQFLNKNKGVFWGSAMNVIPASALYWQQAYPMHTLMFSYERIKDSDPVLASQYLNYFSRWVANNGNNWYGNKKNGFYNQYTDDMAWIALVLLHMYEITGKQDLYNKAKVIYDDYMLEDIRIVDDEQGWGLIWRINDPDAKRNACTNTPAGIIACKLYDKTANPKYLNDAKKIYNFMRDKGQTRVNNNGRVGEPPLSYTQGTWIEMCRQLYHFTNDRKYLDDATTCIDFTMKPGGRCTIAYGVLRGEGQSADQSNFKGGLIPYMVNYANDPEMPQITREKVKQFLIFNAETLWFHNMDKSKYPKVFANFVWNALYNVEGNPGSLGAHSSGAALIEGVTRLE